LDAIENKIELSLDHEITKLQASINHQASDTRENNTKEQRRKMTINLLHVEDCYIFLNVPELRAVKNVMVKNCIYASYNSADIGQLTAPFC